MAAKNTLGRSSSRRETTALGCRRSERDQRERRTFEPFTPREERSDESGADRDAGPAGVAGKGERLFFNRSPSRAAPAARVRAAPAIELGAPAGCFDGLVRFDDFEMQCNGGEICVAEMERNGEAAN